jgi:phenylacetate-coenzyme A ligase PaaK-like adenylate-forming protein
MTTSTAEIESLLIIFMTPKIRHKLRKRVDTLADFETQLYTLNEESFENIALSLFRHQAVHNDLYKRYIALLGIDPRTVSRLSDIPFLPIAFFKSHLIQTGTWTPETEFRSSGTAGMTRSRHLIKDVQFYLRNAERCFTYFFRDLRQYHFLALLPSYLERNDSSLVAMMNHFIVRSGSPRSGFYLRNPEQLIRDAEALRGDGRKIMIWGVSFALLDLAERFSPDLSHCIIVETGGMKGRRSEITRAELHSTLCQRLNVGKIVSEYGMTELLSQAYSFQNGDFQCPPGLKVVVRDVTDPLERGISGTGGLNFIDLANFRTIAFLETEDLGKINTDGSFSVVGRMDNSDVRGCNLLVDR